MLLDFGFLTHKASSTRLCGNIEILKFDVAIKKNSNSSKTSLSVSEFTRKISAR